MNTRLETSSCNTLKTKKLDAPSIDDIVLEMLIDSEALIHDQSVESCLLRVVEVPTWEKMAFLKKEGV